MGKAIVLCGGQGTRLRPYTYTIPKPMLPLGRRPILEYVVSNLKSHGFNDLIFTVGYRGEKIREHFGNGKKFGVKITYFDEGNKPSNTAGSILPAKRLMKDSFLVVMGDYLTTLNVKKLFDHHKKSGAIATLALKRFGVPLEYGLAHVTDDKITRFDEKPILQNLINAGIYAFDPRIFDFIRPNEDFARDVFPRLLQKGERIAPFIFEDYWLDIGRTHDYENIHQLISLIDLALRK